MDKHIFFIVRSGFKIRIRTVNCPYSSLSNEVRIVVTLLVLVMSVSPITVVRSVTLFS